MPTDPIFTYFDEILNGRAALTGTVALGAAMRLPDYETDGACGFFPLNEQTNALTALYEDVFDSGSSQTLLQLNRNVASAENDAFRGQKIYIVERGVYRYGINYSGTTSVALTVPTISPAAAPTAGSAYQIVGNVLPYGIEPYNNATDGKIATVAGITKATDAVIVVTTTAAHGFATGEFVKIVGTSGSTQVNDRTWRIVVTSPTT